MIYEFLGLLLLFHFSHCDDFQKSTCTKELDMLATSQMNFVQCSTMHAVPVRLCIGCEAKYTDMVIAFDALVEDTNCSVKYFNKDRINIVSTTQSVLTDLWTKARCDDCFNGNHSFVFNDKLAALTECFALNEGQECTHCALSYEDLNKFYINLDQHNNGEVCYDLQDSMNRTRLAWSKEYKCCRRQFNMTLFLIAISFVAFLPLIFYGGVFALTKRLERNHATLNEDPEMDEPMTPLPTAASSTAILPTRTNSPPAHKPSPKTIADSDDDDDDDDIVASKAVIAKKL